MIGFLASRLGQAIMVLLAMSFVVYGLMGLMPGDPIDLMIAADPKMTSEDAARLRALHGLDKSILERYGHWLSAAMAGDLGFSRLYSRPVLEALAPALANTLVLLGSAFLLALLIAFPAGIAAAARPRSPLDYLVNLFAFAGISMPVFWVGLLLILLFAVAWGWLPASAAGAGSAEGWWDWTRHLILPVATLAIANIGGYARYVRSSLIETLRQDYIRTARAKGAGPLRVLLRHGLRNALIPVVTVVALDLGSLVSGALVTETLFAHPGMGKLIFDAVMGNDFNLALVGLLIATALTLAGNLLADLAYVWLDPRIARP
ncbi:MAG: ABC transporter permease [Magnetospirillum sp. WYHS-4]